MNPSRRNLLKLIGVGAGAAIAAPVLAGATSIPLPPPPAPLDTLKEITDALENDPDVGRIIEGHVMTPRRVKAAIEQLSNNPYHVTKALVGLG